MRPEAVQWLVDAGRWAPSADNMQPWRFTWDGHQLRVRYDAARMEGLTFAENHPATLLSGGAVIENLSQMMMALEMPMSELSVEHLSSGELASVSIPPTLKVPLDVAQHPLFGRHTNRLSFRSEDINKKTWAEIDRLCENGTRLRIFQNDVGIGRIADLVSQASAIRFQTKEVHEWLGRSLRFSPKEIETGDGLDVATLGLPPGGRMFLRLISDWNRIERFNRVGAYRLLAEMEAKSIRQAPALVAIIGKSDNGGAISAGRTMERIWIALNQSGLAVQPFFVVPDQIFRLHGNKVPVGLLQQAQCIEASVENEFALKAESLYMILRVGVPRQMPIRSKRLPTQRIFSMVAG